MPVGPGKYDPVCTLVRTMTNAKAAIVIVIRGEHGDGCSVQSEREMPPATIAAMLRLVADEMDRSTKD